jgi:hypothetical protein
MPGAETTSFENYCRERKAMVDRTRQRSPLKNGISPKREKKKSQHTELVEVISCDEMATAATQPLTPMASHSWSISSNSIIMNSYPGDDQEYPTQQEGEGRHDCNTAELVLHSLHESPVKKAILSYTSDSAGMFSPLYEVTSEHTNVFKSTRKPLPKAGKTPRFGNLAYKKATNKNAGDSLKTERTSNATKHIPVNPGDTLSFDFSMEQVARHTNPLPHCSGNLFITTDADECRKETSKQVSPLRTFEAFIRGEWQLEKVSMNSMSSSTEAVFDQQLDTSVDENDENRADSPNNPCIQQEPSTDDQEFLDAVIEVKDSFDADGNAIIVLTEICPKSRKDATDLATRRGSFGVDIMDLKQRNKPVIDLTCCTDSEVLGFNMPYHTKLEQILSAQRRLSLAESPMSFVHDLFSDTSQYLKWDRVPLQGAIGSAKHPLLVLSEHFRDMNDMTERQLAKARLTPYETQSPINIVHQLNDRFHGWSLQRATYGMVLVYRGEDNSSTRTDSEFAKARSRFFGCSNENGHFLVQESRDDEEEMSVFNSEVIDDTELRAVMKITNDGEDVSIIFPAISFDTMNDEDSDDGLGNEVEALFELQTQLQSAMDVATTLTPTRFSLELSSPFADQLYSKDSSMASFSEVDVACSAECKRGRRRLSRRRKVQFSDDVQEFLYVNEIKDEIPKRKASSRKRTFVGELIGICQDVAEEFSFSCIKLSGSVCGKPSRTRPGKNRRSKAT